ncbi:MAG: alpha-amylase family glycosyl hydrolase [Pseudomonadota bacterium]
MRPLYPLAIALLSCFAIGCVTVPPVDELAPQPYVNVTHPAWTRDAAIYELNIRQFTPSGTFKAAQAELPRLAELGVRIIWLMPIHAIGEKNRKGSLGSPYAVRDYYSVNPEFGTAAEFREFVDAAHALGLFVILDWVANHTAWDNPLVTEHPEWYERSWSGDFMPTPWWDWSDIIDLDYSQVALRHYMIDAMRYWVREFDIDGYRCDVAGYVPLDFWEDVRNALEQVKPVFMLAEWESRDLHARAFDATYAWSWYDAMHAIASGEADTGALFGYYSANESAYPADALRMTHVSNHDKNSWEGTAPEQFGDALEAAIVLSVVGEGMPLIYNGQEAGNEKRLAFFERDPIEWREHPIGELYRQLFSLKQSEAALWNGGWGGRMIPIENDAVQSVLSFVRQRDLSFVLAVMNMSAEPQTVALQSRLVEGRYRDAFSPEQLVLSAGSTLSLGPWEYRILVR